MWMLLIGYLLKCQVFINLGRLSSRIFKISITNPKPHSHMALKRHQSMIETLLLFLKEKVLFLQDLVNGTLLSEDPLGCI
jgi:hypothetical protein